MKLPVICISHFKSPIVLLLLLWAANTASAATIAWTNTAGGNWSVAANWSPNQLPTAGDVAEITTPGTYTVTLNTSPTLAGLLVGGASGTQTLAQAANTLTVHGAGQINTNGQYNFNGGNYSGTNVTQITGRMNWNGGTLASFASLTIDPGATLFMDGTGAKNASGSITNGGTLIWTNTGTFAPVSVVHNLPGGLFEIRTDSFVDHVGGAPVFINEGIIRKTAGAGTTGWQVAIVNSGDIETQTGGQSTGASGNTFNDGTRFLGAGVFTLTGSATFNGTVHSDNLRITGGTHGGTNEFTGLVQWQGGTFAAASAMTIATNGTLFLDGITAKTASGSLTNAGTIIWTNTGNFAIVGVVRNQPGALFDIRTDDLVDSVGGTPVFINEGVIRKSAGAGAVGWQVPLVNSGDIETLVGAQNMGGAGSSFNDGSRFLGAGQFSVSANVAFNGNIHSEHLTLASGNFSGTNVFSGTVQWIGGAFTANAAVTIATNGVLALSGVNSKTVSGALTNAGSISWTDPGAFAIVGVVHNLASGLFQIQNDGLVNFVGGSPVFINEGVVRKVAGAGTTTWQVRLVNRGTVDVQTGTMTLAGGSEFQTGTTLVGDGVLVLNAGTITLSGQIYSENLRLAGATLTGAGTFNGSLDWFSGSIAAALDLYIPTNGALNLSSAGNKTINGTVTNAGTILWEGTGDLRIAGVLHNLPGALFEARNNELLDYIGGTPIFVNEGTFRKAAGTNATASQIFVRNSGTVEVNSGTLNLGAGLTNLAGTVQLGGGRLQLPASQTLNLNGGLLRGFGMLTPHLLNNGQMLAATNGPLIISGNYTQALNGSFGVDLGGLTAGVNHSLLIVSNHAQLSGRIQAQLVNGFVPNVGDAFQVMTFGTRGGDFVCHDGFLLLGHDRRLETQFAPTSLSLTTITAPDPAGPSLSSQTVAGNVVICWPPEFAGYLMQANTNLATTNWVTLGTNSFLVIPIEGSIPERFFRLISQ